MYRPSPLAHRLLLAWLIGCGPAPVDVPVREAWDVPPPPEVRSLDVGPFRSLPAEVGPGATVTLEGVDVEVVDRRDGADGAVLTVYADEEAADRWLEAGAVTWTGGRRSCGG